MYNLVGCQHLITYFYQVIFYRNICAYACAPNIRESNICMWDVHLLVSNRPDFRGG